MSYDWTPETEARAVSLWKMGNSGSVIAEALGGGVTRSAVVAKLDRLRKRGVDVGPSRKGGASRSGKARKKAPEIVQKASPEAAPTSVEMNPTTLLDLKPGQCRFPIDDANIPGTVDTPFCGAKQKDGSSYCEHHHALCMTPYKRRKKPLDRSKYVAAHKFVFGCAA